MNRETPRLKNPSEIVAKEVGVPGVAEAAALAGAGSSADLIVEKTRSTRATCAIAKAAAPILSMPGRARGTVHVVGLGPGTPDWRAPAATAALASSTDWVGYGLYLDLASDVKSTQQEHRFPLGGEEERVRHAIALAKEGKEVALICSGDAGIYAMAALVYEVLDLEPSRIAVNVIPGISAFQAAAAKAGAMIGHDFCCISLSDLLTPWEAIEQVRIIRFADFNPDDVDMLTLVMVGSSQSKSFARGDGTTAAYTPRGYAKKREAAE